MGIREWTIVVGVVVGVAILLWLAARWRKRRYDDIYGYDPNDDRDYDDEYTSELPSGGARTVGYRDPSDIERTHVEIRERAKSLKPKLASFDSASRNSEPLEADAADVSPTEKTVLEKEGATREIFKKEVSAPREPVEKTEIVKPSSKPKNQTPSKPKVEQSMELFGHQVPLLLDPAEEHSEIENKNETPAEEHRLSGGSAEKKVESTSLPDTSATTDIDAPKEDIASKSKTLDSHSAQRDLGEKKEYKKDASAPSREAAEKAKVSSKEQGKTSKEPSSEPPEVIVINLMRSPDAPFDGPLLLRALTELGMRHGDMEIFHYRGKRGNERPQFGMANLLSPGTFDVDNMEDLRTHALCFFLELEEGADNMKLYDTMLSVINKLRDEVGGDIRDENRSVFTIQTREHCRNQIRDFQRRYLIKKQ